MQRLLPLAALALCLAAVSGLAQDLAAQVVPEYDGVAPSEPPFPYNHSFVQPVRRDLQNDPIVLVPRSVGAAAPPPPSSPPPSLTTHYNAVTDGEGVVGCTSRCAQARSRSCDPEDPRAPPPREPVRCG